MESELINELFQQKMNLIYKYLVNLGCSKDNAEDIVQDTFYKALKYIDGIQYDKISAWLFKVAINKYYDLCRKNNRHIHLNIDEDSDIDFVVDYYSEVESDLIVEDNGFFHIWKTPKARNNKRILMIRDSFGMALLPYMQKDFVYGVFAHNKWNTREGLDKLINEYKPDLVVDELVERYFDRFLKYNDIISYHL